MHAFNEYVTLYEGIPQHLKLSSPHTKTTVKNKLLIQESDTPLEHHKWIRMTVLEYTRQYILWLHLSGNVGC
jgi:hypothetical protein